MFQSRIADRVSTHSRLKAAAPTRGFRILQICRFNTQPPEGGCQPDYEHETVCDRFNTQPPEGGCYKSCYQLGPDNVVSTHSRLKAAAYTRRRKHSDMAVSTHSRLKAAARLIDVHLRGLIVSTHSRLKAAAIWSFSGFWGRFVSTHSRLKAAALGVKKACPPPLMVSTHSRLKAAA